MEIDVGIIGISAIFLVLVISVIPVFLDKNKGEKQEEIEDPRSTQ